MIKTSDREIDVLVAEKIMHLQGIRRGDEVLGWGTPGFIQRPDMGDYYYLNDEVDEIQPVPHYTLNLLAAWGVLQKMLDSDSNEIYHRFRDAIHESGGLIAPSHMAARRICESALIASYHTYPVPMR